MINCCLHLPGNFDISGMFRNTSVEEYYRYDNDSETNEYYYMNSFENILVSGGEYCQGFATVAWLAYWELHFIS